MAFSACSEKACSEILDYLREKCPDVAERLLENIAENFGLDAPVDLDPADIAHCLSFQGDKLVLNSSSTGQGRAKTSLTKALAKAESKGVNPAFSSSALAIIKCKHTASLIKDYYPVSDILNKSMHPDAFIIAAMYEDPDMGDEFNLILILSGIAQ